MQPTNLTAHRPELDNHPAVQQAVKPLEIEASEIGGAIDIDGNVTFKTLLALTAHCNIDSTLSSVLHESGIEHQNVDDPSLLAERLGRQAPDIIFLDGSTNSIQIVDALFALGRVSYPGVVQLIGSSAPHAEMLKHVGQRLGLQMLPVLLRPFTEEEVADVLESEGLRASHLAKPKVNLDTALRNGWIEFWYQPKIDLRTKYIVGVEVLARARQPGRGVLPPRSFLAGADQKSVAWLTKEALITAIKTTKDIASLGAKLPLAVNVSVNAMRELPIPQIIHEHRPEVGTWPGLVLDITEKDILDDILRVRSLMDDLGRFGVRLAIDDYGLGGLSVAQLRTLACAELKLDRKFVIGCSSDPTKAEICDKMVHLVHSIGSTAVAIGIERAAEVAMLRKMACDVGQGFLFGQPMPHDRFMALLRERASKQSQAMASIGEDRKKG